MNAQLDPSRHTPQPLIRRRVFIPILLMLISLTVLVASLTLTPPAQALPVPRKFRAADIQVPDGYHIEAIAINLSVPSTAIFDGQDLIVAESGWDGTSAPRILRIKPDGSTVVTASRGLLAPVTGLLVVGGRLYVSHRGKVSVVQSDGNLQDIVTGLPSGGDYSNNQIALGPDGKIYLAQGAVTNAGVVGPDNYTFGWLDRTPRLHDIPCQDVTTLGQNYRSANPMDANPNSLMLTGAFQPFGSPGLPDQVVKGAEKCSGSILRFNPDGSGLQVVAWGLHDPFGLAFDGRGQLWATSHGVAPRGSRMISNDPDYFVRVQPGAWYGWPDYFDGKPVTDPQFKTDGKPEPGFVWDSHPSLSNTYLTFPSQAGANGFAFSPGGTFGFQGNAFVALLGPDLQASPNDGSAAGFRVVRVDPASRSVTDFATNRSRVPAFAEQGAGFDRPSDVIFGPDSSLYIIDWGEARLTKQGPQLSAQTGAVWRIYSQNQKAERPDGPIVVRPPYADVQAPSAPEPSAPAWLSLPWISVVASLGTLAALFLLATLGWQWLQARGIH